MKYLTILWILIIAVGFIIMANRKPEKKVASQYEHSYQGEYNKELDENELWIVVNNWRISRNLNPYTKDDKLCSLAETRIVELREDNTHKGFADHTDDFTYTKLAENLVFDAPTEERALINWINSASHSATLKEDYQYSCIASEKQNAVQIFANYE